MGRMDEVVLVLLIVLVIEEQWRALPVACGSKRQIDYDHEQEQEQE
jgi:hypothetical protein